MLLELKAAVLALASAISGASVEVKIATPSLHSNAVFTALESSRVRPSVLLGAKADFELDDKGQPIGGNRPFANGPQRVEIQRLTNLGAKLYIPPQFTELGISEFKPGVGANMAYAVVDGRIGFVCSNGFDDRSHGLCWQINDVGTAVAIAGAHTLDFEYTLKQSEKQGLEKQVREKGVLLTPERADSYLALLSQSWERIYASDLAEGECLEALSKSTARKLFLSPDSKGASSAIKKLRARGWDVQVAKKPFSGTILWSPQLMFLGSQKPDDFQVRNSRDLGVLIPAAFAKGALPILEAMVGSTTN